MKMIYRTILWMMFLLTISGCMAAFESAEFRIDGLLTALDKAKVTHYQFKEMEFSFTAGNQTVTICPCPLGSRLPEQKGLTVTANISHFPDGIIRSLYFSDNNGPTFVVVDNARRNSRVLEQYSIREGGKLREDPVAGFRWTQLEILGSDGEKLTAAPGKPLRLTASDQRWLLLLIGCKVFTSKGPSNESPGFTADYLLFREN